MGKKLSMFLLAAFLLSGCAPGKMAERVDSLKFPSLENPAPHAYVKEQLSNGLTLFLMEDHSLPLVSFHAMIRTGSVYDPKGQAGLAEMSMEVIRTGGAEDLSGDETDEALEKIGAGISFGAGRDAGWAGGLADRENFARVFSIFTGMLKSPRFEEAKIELSKIRKNTEISRRNDDIEEIAGREFIKLVYGRENPYARTIEYETVKAVTRNDMVKFHRTFFQPGNIIIGVWGDFESGKMMEYIKESLGTWTAGKTPLPPLSGTDFDATQPSVNLVVKEDATQSVIMMGHMGLRRDDPDYFTALVISRILGAGWNSRFSRILRQEKGLAYSEWAGFWGEFGYPGPFSAGVQTQAERTTEAMELMQEEIRLISGKVTDEELSVAKEGIINSEVFWSDTTDKVMERLMRYQYYGYPSDYPGKLLEGIKKVTKEDISRVAKKNIFPDRLAILIVGNPEKFGSPLPEKINIIKP